MYISNELIAYFPQETPLFEQVMGLQGEIFRSQKGRLTQRIFLGNQSYFLKQHLSVSWKEIFKNLLQLKLPVLSAKNEWLAIAKCQSLGIAVAKAKGYGLRGRFLPHLQSFILMEDLTPAISLETYCAPWRNHAPKFSVKHKLIKKVAEIARLMHEGGMNHRDFYLCHFLLSPSWTNDQPNIYLIDLHRAQIRALTPKRWLIKDLAGLYFSSFDLGLSQRDYFRFMNFYNGKSLRENLSTYFSFWEKVKKRGTKLYRDHKI